MAFPTKVVRRSNTQNRCIRQRRNQRRTRYHTCISAGGPSVAAGLIERQFRQRFFRYLILCVAVTAAGTSQRTTIDLSLASLEPSRSTLMFLCHVLGQVRFLNFHQQSRQRHVEVSEEVANSVDCLFEKGSRGLWTGIKELRAQYWKSEFLRKVLSNQRPEFEGIVFNEDVYQRSTTSWKEVQVHIKQKGGCKQVSGKV